MTNAQLREHVIRSVRNSGEYKELRESGNLNSYLYLKIAETRTYADNLMSDGIFEGQAWHWAIREKILRVERD